MVKRAAQALALVAVAGLLGLLLWDVTRANTATGFVDEIAAGGKPLARPLLLEPIDGGPKVSLRSFRGNAVVLNFWASWCIPCKREAKRLDEAYARWKDRGVVFVGVDANDFRADARRFIAKYGVRYLILVDGSGSSLGRWGVTGFPETFFVDRRGRVVDHVVGEIMTDEIEAGIRAARS